MRQFEILTFGTINIKYILYNEINFIDLLKILIRIIEYIVFR